MQTLPDCVSKEIDCEDGNYKSVMNEDVSKTPTPAETRERLAQFEMEALQKTTAVFNSIRQTRANILCVDSWGGDLREEPSLKGKCHKYVYTACEGETIDAIAAAFHKSPELLRKLNEELFRDSDKCCDVRRPAMPEAYGAVCMDGGGRLPGGPDAEKRQLAGMERFDSLHRLNEAGQLAGVKDHPAVLKCDTPLPEGFEVALREYPALPRLREQMALNASRQRQEREVVRMKERDRILKKVAEGDHADLAELKIAALLGRLQNDRSATYYNRTYSQKTGVSEDGIFREFRYESADKALEAMKLKSAPGPMGPMVFRLQAAWAAYMAMSKEWQTETHPMKSFEPDQEGEMKAEAGTAGWYDN